MNSKWQCVVVKILWATKAGEVGSYYLLPRDIW